MWSECGAVLGILPGYSWPKKFLSSGHWSRAETFPASTGAYRTFSCADQIAYVVVLYIASEKWSGLGKKKWNQSLWKQTALPPSLMRQQFCLDSGQANSWMEQLGGRKWTGECKFLLGRLCDQWFVIRRCTWSLVSRVLPCFVVTSLKKQILSCESGQPAVLRIWASKVWVSFGNGLNSLPWYCQHLHTHSFKSTPWKLSRFLLFNAFTLKILAMRSSVNYSVFWIDQVSVMCANTWILRTADGSCLSVVLLPALAIDCYNLTKFGIWVVIWVALLYLRQRIHYWNSMCRQNVSSGSV